MFCSLQNRWVNCCSRRSLLLSVIVEVVVVLIKSPVSLQVGEQFWSICTVERLGSLHMTVTCSGLYGVWRLAPPATVGRHDAHSVACVGLQLHDGARRGADYGLREEITSVWLCPQDVAGRPGNLCELHSDAVTVLGVGLFNGGYFRSWRTQELNCLENHTKLTY